MLDVLKSVAPPSLLAWAYDACQRKEQREALPAGEEGLLKLVLLGASTFGARLLDAKDEDDLDGCLDDVIEDAEFSRLQGLITQWVTENRIACEEAAQGLASGSAGFNIDRHFGTGLTGLLEEVFKIGGYILQAIHQISDREMESLRTNQEARSNRPLDFLDNPSIPPPAKRAMLAATRADACAFGLLQALVSKQKPAPSLIWNIGARMLEGERQYLRLLASLPGITIPEDIVPPEERLDLARLETVGRDAEWGFQILRFMAVQSGQDFYLPFPGRDDE